MTQGYLPRLVKGFIEWLGGGGLPILTTEEHFPHLIHPVSATLTHGCSFTLSTPSVQSSTQGHLFSRNKTFISTQKITKAYILVSVTFGKSLQQKPNIAACCPPETRLAWASLAGML